jgi:hypothetical protein
VSAPLPLEPPRHIHYCKDLRSTETCTDRGYCECVCGARAQFTLEEGAREWVESTDANQSQKGVQG